MPSQSSHTHRPGQSDRHLSANTRERHTPCHPARQTKPCPDKSGAGYFDINIVYLPNSYPAITLFLPPGLMDGNRNAQGGPPYRRLG
jgi:hypothetical protein